MCAAGAVAAWGVGLDHRWFCARLVTGTLVCSRSRLRNLVMFACASTSVYRYLAILSRTTTYKDPKSLNPAGFRRGGEGGSNRRRSSQERPWNEIGGGTPSRLAVSQHAVRPKALSLPDAVTRRLRCGIEQQNLAGKSR